MQQISSPFQLCARGKNHMAQLHFYPLLRCLPFYFKEGLQDSYCTSLKESSSGEDGAGECFCSTAGDKAPIPLLTASGNKLALPL